jgi:hypothetical protein
MNPSNTWKGKLEAASFFCHLKIRTGSVISLFLILGNKGGVAIRLEYEKTSLCFVSSHLAAHTDGTEKRNKDYQEICKNLIFDGLAITDHDMVFWMGDLNYRYEKSIVD